jgi:hypothetical protein
MASRGGRDARPFFNAGDNEAGEKIFAETAEPNLKIKISDIKY